MSAISSFVNQQVQVILYDGRVIVGKLMGFDVRANIILADSVEREFSEDEGVEMVPLGLYMIKGDNVAMIGEIDTDKDATIDYSSIRAPPLNDIRF
ncbi:hypothetical protein FFLO_05249 [Filobasidium floriforme]|uniref:LSM2-LSM8 complex subunit LSM8 n=1 Tax=Filobasidium floriforme TaxID=5210 RepID=A0A8K0JHC4_9TREE|nr:uncharacterized protein HD553DRAFT_316741 [Filobasidium floriforme]KAG7530134.1 hypothetical protein FFLO_05249 [Filobasidium floriforme]KAH8080944.1 hypothetical protein HD553DRAFT_316741 [Filobasidium floriforme]